MLQLVLIPHSKRMSPLIDTRRDAVAPTCGARRNYRCVVCPVATRVAAWLRSVCRSVGSMKTPNQARRCVPSLSLICRRVLMIAVTVTTRRPLRAVILHVIFSSFCRSVTHSRVKLSILRFYRSTNNEFWQFYRSICGLLQADLC